ncbi:MAG: HNH endonuclease [Pseudomonas sp.]|nr:MAG: HNH endonuclease [Pseudomonas sp.]
MKQLPSLERLRELVDYNQGTGVFTRKIAVSYSPAGKVLNHLNPAGYVIASIDGQSYFLHRIAFKLVTGKDPEGDIDHINGVRHDNCWNNLRDVPRAMNNQNRQRANKGNAFGLLGVRKGKREGQYRATICVGGKFKSLGYFSNIEDAHNAYVSAKRIFHPGGLL